jgi:hypothetical protein
MATGVDVGDMMKEKPILFTTEMVQAILAKKKNQTRRVIKPQPPDDYEWLGWLMDSFGNEDQIGKAVWGDDSGNEDHYVKCPYGDYGK